MKKKPVEMRGILPRYPEDEKDFILGKLSAIEPCSIAELVRHLGGADRNEGGGPSLEYERVKTIMKYLEKEGAVSSGIRRGSWRVAEKKK